VPKAARLDLTELTVTPERVLRERLPDDPPCGRLLIYSLEGELFFGAAPALDRHFDTLRERVNGGGGRVVVLRVKNARNPDAVCLTHFEEFIRDMDARRVHVLLCGVRPDFHQVLRNTGLEALLGPKRIFEERPGVLSSTLDAVRHAYDLLDGDYCLTCPKRDKPANGQEGWYYMI
jgi:SulP family sulfate permease